MTGTLNTTKTYYNQKINVQSPLLSQRIFQKVKPQKDIYFQNLKKKYKYIQIF